MTHEEWKKLKDDNARAFCEAIEANAEQKIRDLCNEEINSRSYPSKLRALELRIAELENKKDRSPTWKEKADQLCINAGVVACGVLKVNLETQTSLVSCIKSLLEIISQMQYELDRRNQRGE